ncbi:MULTISPECIES: urea transporter [Streptomyces]|uniref:urea transporter n=1 Tax=Streptomyces TaxID=1883 RepID=UPI0019F4FAC3|nr:MULTISPECIES: urea transporter [Streptomyces]KAF2779643.1 Urea transporter [Streptomyces sp. OM5714]MCX5037379.1 urea transporter [Streptomyces coelicoflavus]NHI09195.1 Urea transporter [Streptomyces sp. KO7888]
MASQSIEHGAGSPTPQSSAHTWKGTALGALRGVGQVDFQASLWCSLVILVALWVAGWEIGLFATIGAVVATLTARLLAVSHDSVTQGLMTYCGVLGGIAMVVYLGNHPSTYVMAVCAAVTCTLVTATLGTLLTPFGLRAFTGPFCLVSLVMVLGAPSFERVWHGTPESAVTPATPKSPYVSWTDVWQGFFSNFSQIFFVETWYVGLIMLAGLFLAGWRVGLFAVLGSVVGILTAWALGAPAALIGEGIYGYNAVLTSLAFGVVLLRATAWNFVYTVLAAAATTALTASLSVLFEKFGSHTFTWPFNIATWALLAAVPFLSRITLLADDS